MSSAKEEVQIKGPMLSGFDQMLTKEALSFVAHLHKNFNQRRLGLLAERRQVQQQIDQGIFPTLRPETAHLRNGDWQVASIPNDLQNRRTEITGPTDRKMVINALNSGAKVFMADFEDANSPTWENCIHGQINLFDAIRNQIDFTAENAKKYQLNKGHAVLKVRVRGWHLEEKHLEVDGERVSGALFDFGLFFFHNAKELLSRGSGPYFYLPKLENHLEARLWNDVFVESQNTLGLPTGTIKVTVLIETITAAFEMEEILYELKDHIAALNAGRWDYIFSIIKKFHKHREFILPDRSVITMSVPFMKVYALQVVKACHKRGAHAIGGMSAFIPAKSEDDNKLAFEKVKIDKRTEAAQGYDGTWVAHPFLVPVAMEEFNKAFGDQPHQKKILPDFDLKDSDFINVQLPEARITEQGLRTNINVGILYIESWLSGVGAAALYNLMEDAATAEISRAQIWQWLHHPDVKLDDGREVNKALYKKILAEEIKKCKQYLGEDREKTGNLDRATDLFDKMVSAEDFKDFLTLDAYELLKG